MNGHIRTSRFFATVLLSGAATAASGGELGATSRDTVSISITVVPHVQIVQTGDAAQRDSVDAGGHCAASSSIRNYHLAVVGQPNLVGHQPGIRAQSASILATDGASCRPLQVGDEPVTMTFRDRSLRGRASPEPLTVLIVPD